MPDSDRSPISNQNCRQQDRPEILPFGGTEGLSLSERVLDGAMHDIHGVRRDPGAPPFRELGGGQVEGQEDQNGT